MSKITCICCRTLFESFEEQKLHFQTEYHCQNSRRSAKSQPPMTQSEYLEFLQIKQQQQQLLDSKKRKVYKCVPCDKQFNSENAFRQHLESNKHISAQQQQECDQPNKSLIKQTQKQIAAQNMADSKITIITEIDNINVQEKLPSFLSPDEYELFKSLLPQLNNMSDEEQDELILKEILTRRAQFPQNQCLFCEHIQDGEDYIEQLLDHMYKSHSFVIPMRDYCKQQQQLIAEMQNQVSVARSCLVCFRGFKSATQCQKHMCAAGHTVFMPEPFVQQFIDFYDFSESYPPELLKLIQDENNPEILKEIQQQKFYMRMDDFKYYIEGEQVEFLEWKEWKKYHVPEWLKILEKQREYLGLLKGLKGDVWDFVNNKQQEPATQTEGQSNQYLCLRQEVKDIINHINDLGKGCKSNEIIRIDENNYYKYILSDRNQDYHQINKQLGLMLDNKNDVKTEIGLQISMFKKYFKRQTKVWLH